MSSPRDLNPSLAMAGADALAAWSLALHIAIEAPRITVGPCRPIEDPHFRVVACADRELYSIHISARLLRPGIEADLRTILLHEIGHLLGGYQHLQGDALMDREPGRPLTRPTSRAVQWVARDHDD